MPAASRETPQVLAIREFNRFYTARLGLLRKRYLGGEFSLTEARMLYELGSSPQLTASALGRKLELDAGYISRLLASLTKRKLVCQTVSKMDGREKYLLLSPAGESKVAELNEQSARQIEELLASLNPADRETVAQSLTRVRSILGRAKTPEVQIVRLTETNGEALRLLNEYYEAVSVVQRDSAQSIRALVGDRSSGLWLAYLDGKAVGCVVLRTLPAIPFAVECKRLYIQPQARGRGLADALLDAQEEHAVSQGMKWIYLDTYDDLKAAISLYQKRGYVRCERYNDNPQATQFFRKQIG